MATDLKQTKNSFKVIGKVTRIDKDGAYKEEVMNKPSSKRHGETYRSLRFGVQTSDTNTITVQMFDYEPTEVFLWNSEKRKKDQSYKGDRVPFAQWEANQDSYREQGYAVLQTRVGLTYGEDGKLQSQGLPSFVAQQEIYNHLDNGDSVVVEGEIRYSTYENREGKEVEQKSYNIKKVIKLKKDVDFEDEKFEEVTYFEQELVFVGADIDKKEGKAYVTGRVINYDKTFHDTQLVVNFKNESGEGFDAGMVKLAEAFAKRFKFGDVINVFGDTLNRVILSEEEAPEDDSADLFAEFGGKKKPKHAESFVSRTYVQELTIHGVDAWDKGVYGEDDFVKEELIEKDNPFADELGGKSKKKNNPFDIGEDNGIGEDDLPF
ncbi:MAG: hypothetical protein ABS939_08425 [Psychrobacillus sp.]